MWAAVDRDDSVEAAIRIVVQKDDFPSGLHDLRRRPDARHTGRIAAEDGIRLHLPLAQVSDLGEQLRLVLRKVWRDYERRAGCTLRRRRALGITYRAVRLGLWAHEVDSEYSLMTPCAVEVDPIAGCGARHRSRKDNSKNREPPATQHDGMAIRIAHRSARLRT